MVEKPDIVDTHVLTNYLDKIRSVKRKFEGLEKEILSLNDFGGRLKKASHIKCTLFDLRVAISGLTE